MVARRQLLLLELARLLHLQSMSTFNTFLMLLALRLPTAAPVAHAALHHRPGSPLADVSGKPRVETRIRIPEVLDWLTPRDKRPLPRALPCGSHHQPACGTTAHPLCENFATLRQHGQLEQGGWSSLVTSTP